MQSHKIIWISFICIMADFLVDVHAAVERLKVDITLRNQVIYEKVKKMYAIEELVLGAAYEVRISYPAVIPTDFVLVVEPIKKSHNRKLLNVEQLRWNARHENYYISVVGVRNGLPFDEKKLGDPVTFNIVVNRIYFGCSFSTWKLIVACLFTNIIVIVVIVPRLLSKIDKMLGDEKNK